jgi:7-cyano-7-deazaguanine synthase in queuosine biosynthesis
MGALRDRDDRAADSPRRTAMSRVFVTAAGSRSSKPKGATILSEGSTLLTGTGDFEQTFGSAPTSLEADLLRLAAAIFAADRASARGEREDIGRQIELSVPIANVAILLPLVRDLERVLRFLSNDGWTIELRQQRGSVEGSRRWPSACGHTLLFSGGLDSLAAALEFADAPHHLQLISHRTQNTVTSGAQRTLADELSTRRVISAHRQFFVSSRSGRDLTHDEENSQRTRSFLFLVLGSLAARRTGQRTLVYLAENGQMAIHLPLDSSRIGAFSTHTAHPHVLVTMAKLMSAALGTALDIQNPYVYRTKREVVEQIVATAPDLIPVATSCWRNSRLRAGVTHCGSCVPCQVRRIAIETCCPDLTAYGRDLWRERLRELPWDDDGRRNLSELVQFAIQFKSLSAVDLTSTWPELISRDFDGVRVIEMYKRFAVEAMNVWQQYPEVRALM